MQKIIISLIILFSTPVFAQIAQQRQDSTQAQKQDVSITTGNKQNIPVARASAYAPNIISKCSGSLAGGAQGQFFGLSLAGSYKDEFCERAELIKLAMSMGHNKEADELFYQFPLIKSLNKETQKEDCDYPTKCGKRK